ILHAARALVSNTEAPEPEPDDRFLARASYVDGVVRLVSQLADALAFVHAKGVLHRDLKPSNVLVSPAGRPRLLDFNLSADESADGPFGGTLPYMSPEQLRIGLREEENVQAIDARSDLFSLGVMLYELLAGTHPFGPIPLGPVDEVGRFFRHVIGRRRPGYG